MEISELQRQEDDIQNTERIPLLMSKNQSQISITQKQNVLDEIELDIIQHKDDKSVLLLQNQSSQQKEQIQEHQSNYSKNSEQNNNNNSSINNEEIDQQTKINMLDELFEKDIQVEQEEDQEQQQDQQNTDNIQLQQQQQNIEFQFQKVISEDSQNQQTNQNMIKQYTVIQQLDEQQQNQQNKQDNFEEQINNNLLEAIRNKENNKKNLNTSDSIDSSQKFSQSDDEKNEIQNKKDIPENLEDLIDPNDYIEKIRKTKSEDNQNYENLINEIIQEKQIKEKNLQEVDQIQLEVEQEEKQQDAIEIENNESNVSNEQIDENINNSPSKIQIQLNSHQIQFNTNTTTNEQINLKNEDNNKIIKNIKIINTKEIQLQENIKQNESNTVNKNIQQENVVENNNDTNGDIEIEIDDLCNSNKQEKSSNNSSNENDNINISQVHIKNDENQQNKDNKIQNNFVENNKNVTSQENNLISSTNKNQNQQNKEDIQEKNQKLQQNVQKQEQNKNNKGIDLKELYSIKPENININNDQQGSYNQCNKINADDEQEDDDMEEEEECQFTCFSTQNYQSQTINQSQKNTQVSKSNNNNHHHNSNGNNQTKRQKNNNKQFQLKKQSTSETGPAFDYYVTKDNKKWLRKLNEARQLVSHFFDEDWANKYTFELSKAMHKLTQIPFWFIVSVEYFRREVLLGKPAVQQIQQLKEKLDQIQFDTVIKINKKLYEHISNDKNSNIQLTEDVKLIELNDQQNIQLKQALQYYEDTKLDKQEQYKQIYDYQDDIELNLCFKELIELFQTYKPVTQVANENSDVNPEFMKEFEESDQDEVIDKEYSDKYKTLKIAKKVQIDDLEKLYLLQLDDQINKNHQELDKLQERQQKDTYNYRKYIYNEEKEENIDKGDILNDFFGISQFTQEEIEYLLYLQKYQVEKYNKNKTQFQGFQDDFDEMEGFNKEKENQIQQNNNNKKSIEQQDEVNKSTHSSLEIDNSEEEIDQEVVQNNDKENNKNDELQLIDKEKKGNIGKKGKTVIQEQNNNNQTKEDEDSQQESVCKICNEGDYQDNDKIIYCDKCNISVHQVCYGINKIPDGEWVCELCKAFGPEGKYLRCPCCTRRGGAMRPTSQSVQLNSLRDLNPSYFNFGQKCPTQQSNNKKFYDLYDINKFKQEKQNQNQDSLLNKENQIVGESPKTLYYNFQYLQEKDFQIDRKHGQEPRPFKVWMHLSCMRFLNCYNIQDNYDKNMIYIDGFNQLVKCKYLFNQTCRVCNTSIGACTKCQDQNCQYTYHPECARRRNVHMETLNLYSSVLYCENHTPLKIQRKLERQESSNKNEIISFLKDLDKFFKSMQQKQLPISNNKKKSQQNYKNYNENNELEVYVTQKKNHGHSHNNHHYNHHSQQNVNHHIYSKSLKTLPNNDTFSHYHDESNNSTFNDQNSSKIGNHLIDGKFRQKKRTKEQKQEDQDIFIQGLKETYIKQIETEPKCIINLIIKHPEKDIQQDDEGEAVFQPISNTKKDEKYVLDYVQPFYYDYQALIHKDNQKGFLNLIQIEGKSQAELLAIFKQILRSGKKKLQDGLQPVEQLFNQKQQELLLDFMSQNTSKLSIQGFNNIGTLFKIQEKCQSDDDQDSSNSQEIDEDTCNFCKNQYKQGEKMVQCTDCSYWYHFKCVNIKKIKLEVL